MIVTVLGVIVTVLGVIVTVLLLAMDSAALTGSSRTVLTALGWSCDGDYSIIEGTEGNGRLGCSIVTVSDLPCCLWPTSQT